MKAMTQTHHLKTADEIGVTNVLDVITRLYGLDGQPRGDEYDLPCPDPAHDDRRPSASVNLVTGYWHCFSCGRGGNLVTLGARVLGKHPDDVLEMIKPTSMESLTALIRSLTPDTARSAPALVLPQPADYEDGPFDELYRRGFEEQTLYDWNVRYVRLAELEGHNGLFTIRDSIGVPILDKNKQVLAWCYRRTQRSPEWQPRYLYSGGAGMIRETWFGLQHYSRAMSRTHITVVEGALDAMWCYQAGIPALGLLGASMGSQKLLRLTSYPSVTLLLDCDAGGVAATHRIGQAIGHLAPLRVARYPRRSEAKDPQELTAKEIRKIVRRAIPWLEFKVRLETREVTS